MRPASIFTASLTACPAFARIRALRFVARRSAVGAEDVSVETLVMHDGYLTVPAVGPLDVFTLRSEGPAR